MWFNWLVLQVTPNVRQVFISHLHVFEMNIRIHSYIAVYINKADINHLSDCSLFHSCSLSCTFIIFYLFVSFVVFVMSFAPVCLMYYLFYFFCTYYISDIDNMQFFKCSGFYYYSFYRTVL